LAGIAPAPHQEPPAKPDLKTLLDACAKEGSRCVSPDGDGFRVDVTLPNNRKQMVSVRCHVLKGGLEIVRVETTCAPAEEKAFSWALRANRDLLHCAVGLDANGDKTPYLILRASFVLSELTAATLKASVKEAAFYADWIEAQLTAKDGH